MLSKGTFEVEVDGKKIGFRFGPGAGEFIEEIAGFSLSEYFRRFQAGKATSCLMYFFYGGHKFWLISKLDEVRKMAYGGATDTMKKEITRLEYEIGTCSRTTISDILEKIGIQQALEIHNKALGIPNLPAPNETGQQEMSESTGQKTTTKSPSSDLASQEVSLTS